MNASHTPGPWAAKDRLVVDCGNDAIAMMNLARPVDQACADARLIAAAPNLYRALVALAKVAKVESDAEYRAVLDAREVIAEVIG